MQNFTEKSQQALQQAHELAQKLQHQQVSDLHLLHTLLSEQNLEESIIFGILNKLGVNDKINEIKVLSGSENLKLKA